MKSKERGMEGEIEGEGDGGGDRRRRGWRVVHRLSQTGILHHSPVILLKELSRQISYSPVFLMSSPCSPSMLRGSFTRGCRSGSETMKLISRSPPSITCTHVFVYMYVCVTTNNYMYILFYKCLWLAEGHIILVMEWPTLHTQHSVINH